MTHFLFTVAITCWLVFRVDNRCTMDNKPGKLQFSVKMNAIDFGYKYRYTEIDCCATGYDSLIWYHKRKAYSDWESYPFSWGSKGGIGLKTASNQTLYMRSTPMLAKGDFKCVARNFTTKQEIVHKIIFGVDDEYGRYSVIPYRPQKRVCVNSHDVSVICKADFGSLDDIEKAIDWYFFDKKKGIQQINNSRVSTSKTQKHDNTVTEVVLKIVNITDTDVGNVYMCDITSTLNDGKSYQFNTTLIKCDQDSSLDKRLVAIIVATTASAVLVMVITLIFVVCLCKDSIGQTLRPRIPRAYFKIIGGTNPDLGDKRYHAFVHHSEEETDRNLASELYKDIKSRQPNYSIAVTCDDVQPGTTQFRGVEELASQAATLFVILPTEYESDETDIGTDNVNENNDRDGEVFNGTLFDRHVSSILSKYFENQKDSVTVVCRTMAQKNSPSNRMRDKYHVIAGNSKSSQRRKCLDALIMRMPLPSSSPITNQRKEAKISREPDTRKEQPDTRPLLESTNSTDDNGIILETIVD